MIIGSKKLPIIDIYPLQIHAHNNLHTLETLDTKDLSFDADKLKKALAEIVKQDTRVKPRYDVYESNLSPIAQLLISSKKLFENLSGFRSWFLQALETAFQKQGKNIQKLKKVFEMKPSPGPKCTVERLGRFFDHAHASAYKDCFTGIHATASVGEVNLYNPKALKLKEPDISSVKLKGQQNILTISTDDFRTAIQEVPKIEKNLDAGRDTTHRAIKYNISRIKTLSKLQPRPIDIVDQAKAILKRIRSLILGKFFFDCKLVYSNLLPFRDWLLKSINEALKNTTKSFTKAEQEILNQVIATCNFAN